MAAAPNLIVFFLAWVLAGFAQAATLYPPAFAIALGLVVADRWGTTNFGAINGVFVAPITVGTALAPVAGPALAGVIGGYTMMAIVMAALLTAGTALSAKT